MPYEDSALYSVLQALKFRVTKIEAEQPARLDRLDVLFLWQLNEALDAQEIEEIHHFVKDGGTLIVAGDHESLDSLLFDYGLEMRRASKPLKTSRRIPIDPIFPNHPGGRDLLHHERRHPVNGTGYGTALWSGNRLFGCDIL